MKREEMQMKMEILEYQKTERKLRWKDKVTRRFRKQKDRKINMNKSLRRRRIWKDWKTTVLRKFKR